MKETFHMSERNVGQVDGNHFTLFFGATNECYSKINTLIIIMLTICATTINKILCAAGNIVHQVLSLATRE